jgi:hypothetical protein
LKTIKKYNLIIAFVLLTITLTGQKLTIPISDFLKTRNKVEYYEDSANLFTGRFAPLEVSGFKVHVKSVSVDRKRKKAFISGYVSDYHSKDWKMPGIAIFKARRSGDKLYNKVSLGETSFHTETGEGGQFDLVFGVEKGDRLYFYYPFSWIVEFNIGKFLN